MPLLSPTQAQFPTTRRFSERHYGVTTNAGFYYVVGTTTGCLRRGGKACSSYPLCGPVAQPGRKSSRNYGATKTMPNHSRSESHRNHLKDGFPLPPKYSLNRIVVPEGREYVDLGDKSEGEKSFTCERVGCDKDAVAIYVGNEPGVGARDVAACKDHEPGWEPEEKL